VLKFKNDKPLLAGLLTAKAAQKRKWLTGSGLRKDVTLPIPNLSGEALSACTYAEIVWHRGHYWFHYCIDTPVAEPRHEHLPLKPAGCDLGEIHSVTLATENKALVLSGRAVRAVKQGRAKFLAELSKKMARCKKGSRQWKKYLRAKRYLQQKSDAQIKDWLHKTTKQAVDFLLAEQVTHLVIGKVDGIEKNTRKDTTKKRKTTQRRRQQLSLWEHGRLTAYLTYKAKKAGVVVEETGEAYTSQDCPFCDGRHQTRTRHFFCPVTKTGRHRDVNGAQNIARRKYPMPVTDVSVVFKQPIWIKKYRRRNGVGGDDLARAEAW
jgi:putative transposase